MRVYKKFDHASWKLPKQHSQPSIERAILIKVVLLICFGLLFGHLNPLNIDDRVREYSRDTYNEMFGPAVSETSADRLAVVLLTDGTLDEISGSWPLPYGIHADILQAIIDLKPAALFVDIMFIDERRRDETVGELADTLNSNPDVPIFMAALRKDEGLYVVPELAPVGRKPTSSNRLVPVDEVERRNEHVRYRLVYDEPGQDGPFPEFLSPAMALYRAACLRWEKSATRPPGCREAHWAGNWNRPLEIEWPIGVPVLSNGTIAAEALAGQKCVQPVEGKLHRFLLFFLPRFLTKWFVPGEGSGEEILRQSCPAIPVVLAENILRRERRDPDLAAAIEGKIVVYGLALAGGGDVVQPPHHPPLPGAFVHAAAAENLLRLGADYYSTIPRRLAFLSSDRLEGGLEIASHALLYFFTLAALGRMKAIAESKDDLSLRGATRLLNPLFLLARLIFIIRRKLIGDGDRFARKMAQIQAVRIFAWLILVFLNLALALLWVTVEVHCLRVTPSNWIAIVSIVAAASPLIAPYIEPHVDDVEVEHK